MRQPYQAAEPLPSNREIDTNLANVEPDGGLIFMAISLVPTQLSTSMHDF